MDNVRTVTDGNMAIKAARTPLSSLPKYVVKLTTTPPKIK